MEIALCVLLIFSTGFLRATIIYRDDKIPALTARLESGPARGIYTSKASAEKYYQVVAAIEEYAPDSGKILITKLLPFGYLCTDLKPATPTVWRLSAGSQRLDQYYELYPDRLPDFVFIVDENYGIKNADEPPAGILAEHISGFEKIGLDCGTVYIKP